MLSAMYAVLVLAPFLVLALTVLLWPQASVRLIEAIVPAAPSPRRARARVAARAPRSEADRGRPLAGLRVARAPPLGSRPAVA